MSQVGLSNKQYEILEFIFDQISMMGRPPTIREICKQFGFASPRSASDHLAALEKKGYIHRTKSPRGIQLSYEQVWELFGIPIIETISVDAEQLLDVTHSGTLTPSDLYPFERHIYALYMPDDSMEGLNITQGDLLIVREQEEAEPSDIVLAVWDNQPTIRVLHANGNRQTLEAPGTQRQAIPVRQARIFGVVQRIIRDP